MIRREDSVIVHVVTRVMVPLIQIFALYVIFHGHYSPGGGFQGGALLAASVLLQRVVLGHRASQRGLKSRYGTPLGIAGVVVFTATGLLATAGGGRFLQHDKLPFGLEQATLRSTGILLVELGVALAVTGTLVALFDDLAGEPEEDDAPEPEAEAR